MASHSPSLILTDPSQVKGYEILCAELSSSGVHKTEHVVLLRLNKEQEALYKKYLEVSCMCPTGRRALRKARCAAPEEGAGGALHRTPQSVLHVARV